MRRLLKSASRFIAVAILALAPAVAGSSELVILKGGKTLELSKPYLVRGTQAILTLKDGTVVSVALAEIDRAATQAARARSVPKKSDVETVEAVSPADAARAQKRAPKARLKVGDDEVSHPYVAADEGAKDAGEGEARLEVVDWDQKADGGSVSVKGNLRNAGSASAEGISMLVMGKDDKGKTLASTSANVAAGTLDAGSVTTFTANLAMPARAASLRFVPKWSSAVTTVKGEKLTGQIANSATPVSEAPKGPAKNEAAPPSPAPDQPTYVPRPDYAPPMANAPTSPPDDNRIPYIPNLHEESPPPPPNER